MTEHSMKIPARVCLAVVLLVVLTALVYAPSARYGFLKLDDDVYVTHNPHILQGLTPAGITWVFTEVYESYWIPLTWMSYQLDVSLFGLNPAVFHVENILFHILNAVLLFLLLYRLTRSTGPSLLVALLFAIHPLRVESVVWIAERKDVLSWCFALCALHAYLAFVSRRTWKRYALLVVFFVMSLLAKPMMVSLPVLLLILDFWPLRRVSREARSWAGLVLEKVPLLFISLLFCATTFLTQWRGGSVVSTADAPIALRLVRVALAYMFYIQKTLWPTELAVIYPPGGMPVAMATVFNALVLLLITAAAISQYRRRSYLLAGWLWYLVILFPVTGIVRVGNVFLADRFSYIPTIGLWIMLVWLGFDLVRHRPVLRWPVLGVAVMAVAVSSLMTMQQVRVWRSTRALFEHTVAVTRQNADARLHLGRDYMETGEYEAALECLKQAAVIRPDSAKIDDLIGRTYERMGRLDEAATYLLWALEKDPEDPALYNSYGMIQVARGRLSEGIQLFQKTLALNPDYFIARFNLGATSLRAGNPAQAIRYLKEYLGVMPEDARANYYAGVACEQLERAGEAVPFFQRAMELEPDNGTYRNAYGVALVHVGEDVRARTAFQRALALSRDVTSLNNLAWLLATSKDVDVRDTPRAVQLAREAVEACGYKLAVVETLWDALQADRQLDAVQELLATMNARYPDDPQVQQWIRGKR